MATVTDPAVAPPTTGGCGVEQYAAHCEGTTSNDAGLSRQPMTWLDASDAHTSKSLISGLFAQAGFALNVQVTVRVPTAPLALPLVVTEQPKGVI